MQQLQEAGAVIVGSNVEAALLAAPPRRARALRPDTMSIQTLFTQPLAVVNVGLPAFADNVAAAGGACVGLQWQPPAQGDREGGVALAAVFKHPPSKRPTKWRWRAFSRHSRC